MELTIRELNTQVHFTYIFLSSVRLYLKKINLLIFCRIKIQDLFEALQCL